jgi:hypothetical protein
VLPPGPVPEAGGGVAVPGVAPVFAPGFEGLVAPGVPVVPAAPGAFGVPGVPVLVLGEVAPVPLAPLPVVLPGLVLGVEAGGGVAVPGAGVAVGVPVVVPGAAFGFDGVVVLVPLWGAFCVVVDPVVFPVVELGLLGEVLVAVCGAEV